MKRRDVLDVEVPRQIPRLREGERRGHGPDDAVHRMAEEDPRIAEQIDNNAVDQFLVSPDLRETLTDAAVLNEGAFGKLTGALTGENERAEEFIRLIGAYLYQARRARTEIADTETEAEGL